ncbi:hypothetical protein OAA86_09465, partial [Rhodospirillales bacterium]|nr:hypothetical protein [Rhodospirillales bacterium]
LISLDEKPQSISLFQNVSRDHSPSGHDVRPVPTSLRNVENLLQERGIDICNSAFTPSTLLLSRPSPHCDRQTGTDARNDPSSPEGYYCW